MRLQATPKPKRSGHLTRAATMQLFEEINTGRLTDPSVQSVLARAIDKLCTSGFTVDDVHVIILSDCLRGCYERF